MKPTRNSIRHVLGHPLVIAALVALVLTLTALGSVAKFIWLPAQEEAIAAEAALDKASMELRDLKYRAKLAEDYATRRAQANALEAKLGQGKPEPEFVRDVEALVAKSGAAMTQFSSRAADQNAGISTSYFEFFLEGPYASLRTFIAELPQMTDFAAIERVSLERSGTSVRANLVLRRRRKTS